MTLTTAGWSVARLIRNHDAIQKILPNGTASHHGHSLNELLAKFHPSSTLTVKRSLKQHGRFFMYEEHAPTKLSDDKVAQTIEASPAQLARLMRPQQFDKNKHTSSRDDDGYHYYWTSPIAAIPAAPNTASLANEFQRLFQQLVHVSEHPLLDPRGPSLWMGTSGSATQCHYDVANNIIVQLHGTKRVRCFPPSVGLNHLHVFPDAHPRARKSQVDFDNVGEEHDGCATALLRRRRYPHFVDVPSPSLDVVLRPGDAVEIPAFWFHHIENGHCRCNSNTSQEEHHGNDTKGVDAPSVSVNSFSLSRPMMVAQQIFQKASLRPLQLMGTGHSGPASVDDDDVMKTAPPILKILGTNLLRGLRVVDYGKEEEFIRRHLLDARYGPLMFGNNDIDKDDGTRMARVAGEANCKDDGTTRRCPQKPLTKDQRQAALTCVEQILPDLQQLLTEGEEEKDGTGIALLVGLHLLELWAVELVGASLVAKAWDEALS